MRAVIHIMPPDITKIPTWLDSMSFRSYQAEPYHIQFRIYTSVISRSGRLEALRELLNLAH